jgi:hypothetical protein
MGLELETGFLITGIRQFFLLEDLSGNLGGFVPFAN